MAEEKQIVFTVVMVNQTFCPWTTTIKNVIHGQPRWTSSVDNHGQRRSTTVNYSFPRSTKRVVRGQPRSKTIIHGQPRGQHPWPTTVNKRYPRGKHRRRGKQELVVNKSIRGQPPTFVV